ncbi:MAG: DUF6088 family protein [Akkermansia sp.]
MKISIKSQILLRIKQGKNGWAFSAADFAGDFSRREIDESFSALAAEGVIRRVMRGIYDVPRYSSLLRRETAPSMSQVAKALARKFKWNIYPDGNTSLNYLGLSTQMVAKHIYLSDGPSRKYRIGGVVIEFKHRAAKELSLNGNRNAVLLVHAIRAMGAAHMNESFIQTLSTKFSAEEWLGIYHDANTSAAWIHDVIAKAYQMKEREYETNCTGIQ